MSKVLGARLDRVVERHDDPGDVVLGEAQGVGDGVGRRGLEALAVGRVAELPRDPDWPCRAGSEVRRVGRIVRADGQLARGLERAGSPGAQASGVGDGVAARPTRPWAPAWAPRSARVTGTRHPCCRPRRGRRRRRGRLTPLTVRMSGLISSRNGTGGSVAGGRQPISVGGVAGASPRPALAQRPLIPG